MSLLKHRASDCSDTSASQQLCGAGFCNPFLPGTIARAVVVATSPRFPHWPIWCSTAVLRARAKAQCFSGHDFRTWSWKNVGKPSHPTVVTLGDGRQSANPQSWKKQPSASNGTIRASVTSLAIFAITYLDPGLRVEFTPI